METNVGAVSIPRSQKRFLFAAAAEAANNPKLKPQAKPKAQAARVKFAEEPEIQTYEKGSEFQGQGPGDVG